MGIVVVEENCLVSGYLWVYLLLCRGESVTGDQNSIQDLGPTSVHEETNLQDVLILAKLKYSPY